MQPAVITRFCAIANDNGGGQVVASGTKKAVDQAIEIAKGKGARRAMLLSVSAPFHCALDAACCGSDGRSPGQRAGRRAENPGRCQRDGASGEQSG